MSNLEIQKPTRSFRYPIYFCNYFIGAVVTTTTYRETYGPITDAVFELNECAYAAPEITSQVLRKVADFMDEKQRTDNV